MEWNSYQEQAANESGLRMGAISFLERLASSRGHVTRLDAPDDRGAVLVSCDCGASAFAFALGTNSDGFQGERCAGEETVDNGWPFDDALATEAINRSNNLGGGFWS